MSEDRSDPQDPAEHESAVTEYVAPALTDLGSFAELTEFGGQTNNDFEGTS